MEREGDSLEGCRINVHLLEKRCAVELSSGLGEESDEALLQPVELSLGEVELRFVEHLLRDVGRECRGPADGFGGHQRRFGVLRDCVEGGKLDCLLVETAVERCGGLEIGLEEAA